MATRTRLLVLFPAMAWLMVGLIIIWIRLNDYRPHNDPSRFETVVSVLMLLQGVVLSGIAVAMALRELFMPKMRLIAALSLVACGAYIYIFGRLLHSQDFAFGSLGTAHDAQPFIAADLRQLRWLVG